MTTKRETIIAANVPLVAGAIVQAFFASLTGAKRKN
jgi:hypothetical protein